MTQLTTPLKQPPVDALNPPCLPGYDPAKDVLCAPCTCILALTSQQLATAEPTDDADVA